MNSLEVYASVVSEQNYDVVADDATANIRYIFYGEADQESNCGEVLHAGMIIILSTFSLTFMI